jgi:hypothetical protein
MWLSFLADVVVVLHGVFIVFVAAGGFAVIRWPRLAWLHLPGAAWGAAISFGGWICPLTPLEIALRRQAGEAGYRGGFIEHYIVPLIYPGDLTREHQLILGAAVVLVNGFVYGVALSRHRRGRLQNHRASSGAEPRMPPPRSTHRNPAAKRRSCR